MYIAANHKIVSYLKNAIWIISNLHDHAKKEISLAGLFDKDSDYGGMIGEAVMELIDTFAKQGHSGFSAQLTLAVFNKVADFKPLSPITNDPDEWNDVSEYGSDNTMWQNNQSPNLFSNDGGKTWWDVDEM